MIHKTVIIMCICLTTEKLYLNSVNSHRDTGILIDHLHILVLLGFKSPHGVVTSTVVRISSSSSAPSPTCPHNSYHHYPSPAPPQTCASAPQTCTHPPQTCTSLLTCTIEDHETSTPSADPEKRTVVFVDDGLSNRHWQHKRGTVVYVRVCAFSVMILLFPHPEKI